MFADADLDIILQETGEQISIMLSGVVILQPWGKFREDFTEFSPYEASVGTLKPAILLKTSVMAGITNDHIYLIQGREYRNDGKPQRRADGCTLVKLVIRK